MLNGINKCWRTVPRLTWEHGGPFSFHNSDVQTKVLRWDWDWWRVRIVDEPDEIYDLCLAFGNYVVLFPSRQSGIDAAEVFSSGQHWNVAPLVWADRNGNWRTGGGTDGLEERPQAEPSQGITAP